VSSKTSINPQISDAISTTNVANVAAAPAVGMGSLYASLSNSVAMSAINAVYAQQQTNILHQSVTAKSVALLLGEDS